MLTSLPVDQKQCGIKPIIAATLRSTHSLIRLFEMYPSSTFRSKADGAQ
ncbi:hypothetical protein [Nostoc sp. EfeVER01]